MISKAMDRTVIFLCAMALVSVGLFSENDQTKRKKGFLSFSFSGGISTLGDGDINKEIEDKVRFYRTLSSDPAYTLHGGEWKPLKIMPDLRAELIFNLSRNLGIGLGVESLSKQSAGNLGYSSYQGVDYGSFYSVASYQYPTDQYTYKLSALATSVNIHLNVPISRSLAIFANGGWAYYRGKLFYRNHSLSQVIRSTDYYADWREDSEYNYSIDSDYRFDANSRSRGFHGGLGLEIGISKNLGLVVEGRYRSANFANWKAKAESSYIRRGTVTYQFRGTQDFSWDSSYSWEGDLWHYGTDEGTDYLHNVNSQVPIISPEEGGLNVHKTEISLNGFSIRLGLKLNLGARDIAYAAPERTKPD